MLISRDDLYAGVLRLGEIAHAAGKLIEISIYGGAALGLVWNLREFTRDVDAVIHGDTAFLRQAALLVANEREWPDDWLNDGVKGFLSSNPSLNFWRDFPSLEKRGIRVFVPSPEYLFAMKAMAMRIGDPANTRDIADLRALGAMIGIAKAEDAISLVERYYPENRISPKTLFGLQELFDAGTA